MGKHCAFCDACSAPRILQYCDIIRSCGGAGVRLALTFAERFTQRNGAWDICCRHLLLHVLKHCVNQSSFQWAMHIANISHNNMLNACFRHDTLHLVTEVSQHDQSFCTRVVKLVFHLALGVKRIGVYYDDPSSHCAKYDDRVLQYIRQLNRNTITCLKRRFVLKERGERSTFFIQLGISHGLPETCKRWQFSVLFNETIKDFGNARKLINVDCLWIPLGVTLLEKLFVHLYLHSLKLSAA